MRSLLPEIITTSSAGWPAYSFGAAFLTANSSTSINHAFDLFPDSIS
jgi:hypothetical protein